MILPHPKPSAIFFDLDDTLFDHQYSDHAGIAAIAQHHAAFADTPSDAFIQTGESIMDELWPRVMSGELSFDDWHTASVQQLFAYYQCNGDTALHQDLGQRYRQTYVSTWRIIDGAIDLLKHLRGKVTVGIITNHVSTEQILKLDALHLTDLIDFMVCVDQADLPKPDAPMFEIALRQAKVQAENAVMVGDSWANDVIGATALGIRAVWLNRGQRKCPNPRLATEIHTLQPTETIANLLLNP